MEIYPRVLMFFIKPQNWLFHVVVLQATAKKLTKVKIANANLLPSRWWSRRPSGKASPNASDISTQHLAALLGTTCCIRFATPAVAICCDMLQHVG